MSIVLVSGVEVMITKQFILAIWQRARLQDRMQTVLSYIPRKARFPVALLGGVLVVAMLAVTWQAVFHPRAKAVPSVVIATTNLNKDYTIATTNTDKKPAEFHVAIKQVRLMQEVQVQGKAVLPEAGKAFLLLDLELNNKSDKELKFQGRDFFRLIVDDKPYAPQFYNSDMLISPVSVKDDRVGFVVDKTAKHFKIQVGELTKPSEVIDISF